MSKQATKFFTLPLLVIASLCHGQIQNQTLNNDWWSPGDGKDFGEYVAYPNALGLSAVLNVDGKFSTRGHPFFEAIGDNGRACVTCHQPADGMSISLASINQQWQATKGSDPLFAMIDGANCPHLPAEKKESHSLLLNRGLFRVFLPWPPQDFSGATIEPEFSIEVVQDPAGCNIHPQYGLNSSDPHISVYRRPRPVANFKYFAYPRGPGIGFNIKDGTPLDRDPESGHPGTMNILADARAATLTMQMQNAAAVHLQKPNPLSKDQIKKIFDFEAQVFMAQSFDHRAGNLIEEGGPDSLGPYAMANGTPGLGDNFHNPVFGYYDTWKNNSGDSQQSEFRQSIARGADIFFIRNFWIRDATHINSIGLGNPLKRTCATCHNARMTGMDLAPGWVDLGTTTYPTWNEKPTWNEDAELPVFKLICKQSARPHPFLGREIYTHDPGRALISGRCVDIGSITMQQMRGLAARAPYFANGSAKTIAEIVDYYDRRFNIGYSEQERQDLVNFLSVL